MDEFYQTAPKIQIGAKVKIIILSELSWNQIIMSKRMLKPSERNVVCFYCSESMQFKALEKHTIRRHSGLPAQEKGTVSVRTAPKRNYSLCNWRHRLFIHHTKPVAEKKFFNVFTVFGGVELFLTFVLPSAAPSLISLTILPPSAAANFFLQ